MEYNMQHESRGRVIIINNIHFNPVDKITNLESRLSSAKDAEKLKHAVTSLGYNEADIMLVTDLSAVEMQKLLVEEAERDHSNEDTFMCIVLSHGFYDKVYFGDKMLWVDLVWGTDAPVALRLLTECFHPSKCPTLRGKPKIFIVQACRGGAATSSVLQERSEQYERAMKPTDNQVPSGEASGGVDMDTTTTARRKPSTMLEEISVMAEGDDSMDDSTGLIHTRSSAICSEEERMDTQETVFSDMPDAGGEKHTAGAPLDDFVEEIHRDSPIFVDFLLFYATQPFHVAFINAREGAFFVHALCNQLEMFRDRDEIDMLQILTRVNHDVACNFTSEVTDERYKGYTNKKQMPRISSRLTRRLIFKRKKVLARSGGLAFPEQDHPQKRGLAYARTESGMDQGTEEAAATQTFPSK